MLHGMKYYGRRKVCRQMGNWLAAELSATGFFDGIDCLIPVPLHPCRLRQRGYNQSGLLAEGISEQTGIPLCTDALVRTHNNRTQTHKSGYERWQNTDGLLPLPYRLLRWQTGISCWWTMCLPRGLR